MKWIADHKFGIWAFLVAVAFVPNIMSAAIVGRWAIIAIGIPLVARIEFKFPFAIQFALAMGFAWSAASVLYAPDRMDSLLQLFFMLMLIGVMGAASQMKTLDDAMTGMCWGIVVSAMFCISLMFGHPLVEQGTVFYGGLFYNSEVLSEFAAPLLVWAIVKQRWLFLPALALPIFANNSRGALISIAVALLIIYWPKRWKNRAILVALTLLAVFALGLYFTTFNHKLGSAALRASLWLETIWSITLSGHGLGWYHISHVTEEFAHSDVLQSMAEIGVGALCFALIPVYALFRNRGTDVAERAAFIVICIELAISFPLRVPASAFLAALLAGYLVSRSSVLRMGGYHSRDHDGADNEWSTADRHFAHGRSGFRSFAVPFRLPTTGVSQMDSAASLSERAS